MSETLGTVLLVDDDDDARTVLTMLLSTYDVKVVGVGSGEEALQSIDESAPNLVLLDFDMPGMDGGETLKRIRQTRSQDELPVVMVSNRQDSKTIVEALDNGANDYVTKSTDPAVLEARIRRHLIYRRLPAVQDRPYNGMIGSYRLEDKLGEGPTSSTYSAVDTRDNVARAIRVLKPGYKVDLEKYGSWEPFHHRLLADLLDVGTEPVDYLVYELVEGTSLEEYIDQNGALSRQKVLDYTLTLARAVQAVHQLQRVHGELRPSNIKIADSGPVVLDFGFSELLIRENELTRSDEVSGHPAYLAPESLGWDGTNGSSSDIYAVGAVLFILSTGRHPFDGTMAEVMHQVMNDNPVKPSSLREDQERIFDFVCARLLKKKPEERYSSIDDVVQKLSELSEEQR